MDRPALRRVLLDLIGTAKSPESRALNPAEWAELDRIALQHRLQPLLFATHRDNIEIPAALRSRWQAAHRLAALQAMVQLAELTETCALLEASGYEPIALKGAWLAAHAYPEAALRPMRNLDLLVAPETVIPAFETLLRAGYCLTREADMPLEQIVRIDKHMPPLVAPRGTVIKLHHRLWERDGRLDHASLAASEAQVRQRARRGAGGLRYPVPQDLLTHLIVHAVSSHRLDCGPLILADLDFLLRAAPIDWPDFWVEAATNGWRDGARLVLDLVAHYRPNAEIVFAADPGPVTPAAQIAAGVDLLLQDLDTRASAGFAAARIKDGAAKRAAQITDRRNVVGEMAVTRDATGAGGFLGRAGSRLLRSLRDLSRADVRRQSRQLAALSRSLDQ